MSKARAAVIGLGSHGFRHLQAYAGIEDVDVVAVCDVQQEAVQRAMAQNQNAHGYSNWTELLQNEELDIVSIVTMGPHMRRLLSPRPNGGSATYRDVSPCNPGTA